MDLRQFSTKKVIAIFRQDVIVTNCEFLAGSLIRRPKSSVKEAPQNVLEVKRQEMVVVTADGEIVELGLYKQMIRTSEALAENESQRVFKILEWLSEKRSK